jgi:hypothetical protein
MPLPSLSVLPGGWGRNLAIAKPYPGNLLIYNRNNVPYYTTGGVGVEFL